MTPLRSCPRCTQPLPISAGYCRRCGIAIHFSAMAEQQMPIPAPLSPPRASKSMLRPIVLFLLVIWGAAWMIGYRSVHTANNNAMQAVPVSPQTIVAAPGYREPVPDPRYGTDRHREQTRDHR